MESKFDNQTVIDAGHPPVAKGVALVDWDGVIQKFGNLFAFDSRPNEGVKEAMQKLRDSGYRIIIFTSRLSATWHYSEGWDHDEACAEQTAYMIDFTTKWGIPCDGITSEKIPAQVYFDDKAVHVRAGDYGLSDAVFSWLRDS